MQDFQEFSLIVAWCTEYVVLKMCTERERVPGSWEIRENVCDCILLHDCSPQAALCPVLSENVNNDGKKMCRGSRTRSTIHRYACKSSKSSRIFCEVPQHQQTADWIADATPHHNRRSSCNPKPNGQR